MFKVNYGYGTGKPYSTLKGARIAAAAFCKKSGQYRLDIIELRNGTLYAHHEYLRK